MPPVLGDVKAVMLGAASSPTTVCQSFDLDQVTRLAAQLVIVVGQLDPGQEGTQGQAPEEVDHQVVNHLTHVLHRSRGILSQISGSRHPVMGQIRHDHALLLARIDVDELQACHRAFYRAGNAALAIAGLLLVVGCGPDPVDDFMARVDDLGELDELHERLAATASPYGDGSASQRSVAAIKELVGERAPIGVVGGHGSPSLTQGLTSLQSVLSLYDTREVDLSQEIDRSLRALLIVGPKEAFTDDELRRIDQYVMRGGSLGIFGGALAIWALLEITYLLGFVTGPRPAPCPAHR